MKATNLTRAAALYSQLRALLPLTTTSEVTIQMVVKIEELTNNPLSAQLKKDPSLKAHELVWSLKITRQDGLLLFDTSLQRADILNIGTLIERRIGELEQELRDLGVSADE